MSAARAQALAINLFRGYDPHPKARRAFLDLARFLLILAGRRGAKTHTGARRMLRMIYGVDLPRVQELPYRPGAARRGTALWWKRRPRLHYWVVAETYDLLKEPIRYLLEFLPPELLEHSDASENTLWLKPDILIEFKTAHDPKRLVGSGLNGVWIVEAARISGEAWPGFMYPLLSANGGWAQAETTPLGRDWTYEHFEIPAKAGVEGYAFHHWTTADNIRMPALVEAVASARRMLPAQYFRREYEASRDAFIGQIYPFSRETMIYQPGQDKLRLPNGRQLIKRLGGQDWGFSNPGAHVPMGIDSFDLQQAELWAVDEVYDSSQLVEDFWVPEVRKKQREWNYKEVAADPAEPDNIHRFKAAGIDCVGHKNYSQAKYDEHERSVKFGIRMLAALMHQGRFHVSARCTNLITELESYRWDQHKSGPLGGVLVERPAPGQKEHAATALRYGATYAMRGAAIVPFEQLAA